MNITTPISSRPTKRHCNFVAAQRSIAKRLSLTKRPKQIFKFAQGRSEASFYLHNVFQRFVDRLNDSQDSSAFQSAMSEAASAFDLPCFAYLRMPRDDRALAALISNYPPSWTEHYLRSHYEKLDPVIGTAHAWTEPFQWGLGTDSFELTKSQKLFFDEAAEFGIKCGFTIPIKDQRGSIAAVTFASDTRREEFTRSIQTNQRVLQLMAICLHAHVRRKLWRDPLVDGVELKDRELECLRWASNGKTAWEIAQILGIRERTVNFHLANVRAKLNVCTLRQAITLYVAAQTRTL